jgi:hypothetical protein
MVRSTIADAQVESAELWVALKDGKVVEAHPAPYELTMALHERLPASAVTNPSGHLSCYLSGTPC